jgi:hypothetical protein
MRTFRSYSAGDQRDSDPLPELITGNDAPRTDPTNASFRRVNAVHTEALPRNQTRAVCG